MSKSFQPDQVAATVCVAIGIVLGIAAGTYGTVTPDEKCNTTPVMPYQGNCSCESQGSDIACEQSMGMTHIHYQCGPSVGDECETPTAFCGKKYLCYPYLCSDPSRVCQQLNHNCNDGSGLLMYKCATL